MKTCENEPAVVTQFQTFKQTVACYKKNYRDFGVRDFKLFLYNTSDA